MAGGSEALELLTISCSIQRCPSLPCRRCSQAGNPLSSKPQPTLASDLQPPAGLAGELSISSVLSAGDVAGPAEADLPLEGGGCAPQRSTGADSHQQPQRSSVTGDISLSGMAAGLTPRGPAGRSPSMTPEGSIKAIIGGLRTDPHCGAARTHASSSPRNHTANLC